MVRTILGLVALTASVAAPALGGGRCSESKTKELFYVSGTICRSWDHLGTYETAEQACAAAENFRAKEHYPIVRVASGQPAGRTVPGDARRTVFARGCKGGWSEQLTTTDAKKMEEAVAQCKKDDKPTVIVYRLEAKEMFHVGGGGCSRSWRHRGSYATFREACDMAAHLRTKEKITVLVTTNGLSHLASVPETAEAKVYIRDCPKEGWKLALKTKERKKAQELVEARKKEKQDVEVVYHLAAQ